MWISKEEWVELKIRLELEKARADTASREVDYWRDKYEEALRRADRVTDKVLEATGLGIASEPGGEETDMTQKRIEQMMRQASNMNVEMFADETETPNAPAIEVEADLAEAIVSGMSK